jgi:hypothetical protein
MLLMFFNTAPAQTAGSAGAFARMGSGARGMGMGNAMTAVISGEIQSYYNPALAAFTDQRSAGATFGILSLDRHLNFLNYAQPIRPTAGISFGLINAGVSNIDGRDADGQQTGDLSTSENQVFLAFSNRLDPRVGIGVAVKLYHSKLYDQVSSTTLGFDLGLCVLVSDDISLGAAVQDLGSKYKWDTQAIYDQNGKSTEDKFPNLRRIAIAYRLPANSGVISAEFENSSLHTNVVRIGAEYTPLENFALRGGIDRLDFGDNATGAKPTFGFSVRNAFIDWTPSLTYAYVFESFAPHGMHIITLSTIF